MVASVHLRKGGNNLLTNSSKGKEIFNRKLLFEEIIFNW